MGVFYISVIQRKCESFVVCLESCFNNFLLSQFGRKKKKFRGKSSSTSSSKESEKKEVKKDDEEEEDEEDEEEDGDVSKYKLDVSGV